MRRTGPIVLAVLFFATIRATADFSEQLAEASAPLRDGVPEVAVFRLQELLKQNLNDQEWRTAAEKLVEAMVNANQSDAAIKLLDDPRLQGDRTAIFWRAQLLAGTQRPDQALPLYQSVAAQASDLRSDAQFGAAEMLRALGRNDEALQAFSLLYRDPKWNVRAQLRAAELYLNKGDAINGRRLLDKVQPVLSEDKRERHFLRGRLEMALQRPDRAISIFESIVKKGQGAAHETVTAALFGLADAHLILKTPETGDDVLENFIEHHPADADLDRIFAKLDELYRAERKPSRNELERWTRDPSQPRRAFAQWYLARFDLRLGRRDRAVGYFEAVRRDRPQSPALAPALIDFAQIKMEDSNFDEALAILKEASAITGPGPMRDRINLLAGQIQYRAKRFDAATTDFEQVAESHSMLASIGAFDAAMGWLQSGDQPRFIAATEKFQQQSGGDQTGHAELRLEEGLVEAANGNPQAADSLHKFLKEFPNNPRSGEAWVALAELAFHASPPQLNEASENLVRARAAKPSPATLERSDYLEIWLNEAQGAGDAKVIDLAKRFANQHASSQLAPFVRMKLAEIYYRAKDFANAETQFELLAEQNPAGQLAEKATFFAAESAMAAMTSGSLDRALAWFDRVVHFNGDLKWVARNEEAAIERKLGKAEDALALYDEVLHGPARPADKREALCGKGDTFFEMASADPGNYQRAIESYDALAADRDATSHWRDQALFKKGLCLEKRADLPGALANFYQILDDGMRPAGSRELFWFYKAGFNAARLLEADQKWGSAAAVYTKLAAVGGMRSEEAKERLDRLRLEHFLRQE